MHLNNSLRSKVAHVVRMRRHVRKFRPLSRGAALYGLGADATQPPQQEAWWQKLLTQGGTAYLTLKAQRDLQKINLQRAKQGQAPITAAEAGTAPTVAVQHELPAEVRGATRMLPWILAGGAAIVLGPRILDAVLPKRRG